MKPLNQISKSIMLIVFLLLSIIAFSQQGISYQGVARDVNNDVLVNANITLDIEILKTSATGTTVYSETHNTMTDTGGVFSVVIGSGLSLNIFTEINWAEDKHFLKVSLNGTEVGTTEFVATPYTMAIGKWQAHKNGVTPKGTGGSVYIGDNAGENDDFTDNNNIGLGINALNTNSTGFLNVAIGYEALMINRDGNFNIGIGNRPLYNNITGSSNVAIGKESLYNNASGFGNVALGQDALHANTSGMHNISFGHLSLYSNNGSFNIAAGYRSLSKNTTGVDNIAFGQDALYNNTTGYNSIAIGKGALKSNETGLASIAIGVDALNNNTENFNVAIGRSSLILNALGNENVALGNFTLVESITGNENVVIGTAAGRNTLGDGNVFLGHNAGFFETGSNRLYINNENGNSNNHFPLIYGEFDNDILGFRAKVGIGTKTPELPLQVVSGTDVNLTDGSGQFIIGIESAANLVMDNNEIQARNNNGPAILYLQNEGGSVYVGGAVVHASDKRLKRDIEDISYGLQDILKLRPTEYFWKGKEQESKSLGLIAQEVNEVIKNVVTYEKEVDKYGVSYTELIPVLIKAIQEQQNIIEAQETHYLAQNKSIQSLEARLEKLEHIKIAINQNE